VSVAPDATAIAANRIQALEAGRLAEVVEFRRRVLRGRLLQPNRMRQWIGDRDRRQQKYGMGVQLDFVVPGEFHSGAVLVFPGSDLAQLVDAARAVSRQAGWPIAQAVGFVLTGDVPAPSLLKAVSHYDGGGPVIVDGRAVWRLSRITLEVDPRVRPPDVMRFYAALRRESPKRTRTVSAETGDLAVFIAQANDGRTWKEARDAWVGEKGLQLIPDVNRFIRDARQAFERVNKSPLTWRNPQGRPARKLRRRRISE